MTIQVAVETLDRSRAYATVHGEETKGQAFAQRALGIEGWPYDHNGDLMADLLNDKQKAKLEQKRSEAAARAEEAKSAAPQPEEDDETEDRIERKKDNPGDDPNEEVNLVQWLRGAVRYKPFEIQEAIKTRYGANKPSTKEAARYLVEEKKLVSWDEVAQALRPPRAQAE